MGHQPCLDILLEIERGVVETFTMKTTIDTSARVTWIALNVLVNRLVEAEGAHYQLGCRKIVSLVDFQTTQGEKQKKDLLNQDLRIISIILTLLSETTKAHHWAEVEIELCPLGLQKKANLLAIPMRLMVPEKEEIMSSARANQALHVA
jgi:hypothetical protein